MKNLASLKADLRVVESEIANPPGYATVADLEKLRRSILRKIDRLSEGVD
ncbi:hypothetical protein [Rhodococcus ruber]